MLFEIITDIIVSGAATISVLTVIDRFRKKKLPASAQINPDGIMLWNWRKHSWSNGTTRGGWQCPKCLSVTKEDHKQMPLCSCEEYHNDHFHFECLSCGYKNKMTTADDK